MFTFHIVGLPHTQTTRAYCNCAFTELIRKFCDMMKSLGHTVILYAGEENEAACDELVTCITRQEQADLIGVTGPDTILRAKYDENTPYWRLFLGRTASAIRERAQEGDFVCLSSGWAERSIAATFPELCMVEPYCGYAGILHEGHHVFPSFSWMNTLYGFWYGPQQGANAIRGRFFDRMIPHFFDVNDFTYREDKENYFAFIGRLNVDKGIDIAVQVSKDMGIRLVVAGQGAVPHGVDYRGLAGVEERARILSGARAVFVPSLYTEMFGKVVIEASLSGTPVITTNFGAFPETVVQGVTGFRCNNYAEFLSAAQHVDNLDSAACRAHGLKFDMQKIRFDYESYFTDLTKLRSRQGWYSR